MRVQGLEFTVDEECIPKEKLFAPLVRLAEKV